MIHTREYKYHKGKHSSSVKGWYW